MIPYNEREVLKLLQEESTQRKGFEMIVGHIGTIDCPDEKGIFGGCT